MEDEQNSDDAEMGGDGDSQVEDPKEARLKKDLHRWKTEAREAKAKLDEIERQKQNDAAERERASGDLQAQLKRMEATKRDLESELAKATETIQGYERGRKQDRIIDRLATDGGVQNKRLLSRSLDLAGLEDADPDTLSDGDYKAALKALRKEAPELFVTATTTTIKPPPGSGQRPNEDKNSDEYWKQKGQAYSARQGHQPYFNARDSGRK